MKFIDLFAGIGGFRLAMERAGHECVAFCEIDKFARDSYKAMYDTANETEWHDIREVTNEEFRQYKGTVDVICGGFPCQAFSVAGHRLGFEDTRGTLFFEIARAASEIKPRYLFLENVKGLLHHDEGRTFETIVHALDELGYDAEWQLLNSKDFGVPQNRERVFIIGHLRGTSGRQIFPIRRKIATNAIKVIGNTRNPLGTSFGQRTMVMDSEGIIGAVAATDYKQAKQVAIPVITPDRVNKRQFGRRFKTDGEPMFTLTKTDVHGVAVYEQNNRVYADDGLSPTLNTMGGGDREPKVLTGFRVRKLTPKECWRLQGFPDELFEKASKVNSNSQLYKQAGNSVTVNVVETIAKRL